MGLNKAGVHIIVISLLFSLASKEALGATNGNTNQDNPILSLVLQYLSNRHGQNLLSTTGTCAQQTNNNNNVQIAQSYSMSGLIQPFSQNSDISIINSDLPVNGCPQYQTDLVAIPTPQQNNQNPTLSLSITDPSTLATLMPILSKYCNPCTEQISAQSSPANSPFQIISSPTTHYQSNVAAAPNSNQDQLINIFNSQQTAIDDKSTALNNQQHESQYTATLQPKNTADQVQPTTANAYYIIPGDSNQETKISKQESKKSSFKRILPLLLNLMTEKDGCKCRHCNYCGRYNCNPPMYSGYPLKGSNREINDQCGPAVEKKGEIERSKSVATMKKGSECIAKNYDSREIFYEESSYEDTTESYYY